MVPFKFITGKISKRISNWNFRSKKESIYNFENYKYVFIFTYGRSGSTLLMGYLNSLPGFCIRGENYNSLVHLCNFYRGAKNIKTQIAKRSKFPVHPWYGADEIKAEEVGIAIRKTFVDTILKPPADTNVIGCKEIRINQAEIPDIDRFLADLMEIFGEVKIIFNHRDILTTSKSGWWKDSDNSYDEIRCMDRRLRESSFASAPNVFHVEYEELIKGPDHAQKLNEFLDVSFDPKTYKNIMATPHSYTNDKWA